MPSSDQIPRGYIWPTTLRLPAPPFKVVYLDLNHWIALAKAFTGHPQGTRYREALTACLDAVDCGTAVFPISNTIYFEVSKIAQYRQRRDVRKIIERVSRFLVVTSRWLITVHEIESLLDRLVGPNPQPVNTMSYLDWGAARAFGMVGGFKITSADGEDVTDEVRSRHPQGPEVFDEKLAGAEFELERKVLEGPTPAEEPELRRHGWDPTKAFAIMERRAQQEIEQVSRFDADPQWRRGRIRDVITAREILIEIKERLSTALFERGHSLESLFPQGKGDPRVFDSMPSFDVAVSLKCSYHRDPHHRWTTNDLHDIDALGSALPYCDVVVTDKAAAEHATRTGLAERLQTTVLSHLTDLVHHL